MVGHYGCPASPDGKPLTFSVYRRPYVPNAIPNADAISSMKLSARGLLRNARPEERLLVLCARTRIDALCAEHIRRLLRGDIDWGYVLNLASSHHLLPLLYWNLNRTCRDALPTNVFISLWTDFEYITCRNKALSLELIRMVKLFDAHGISVIPYKGPAAAVFFYGDVALREFGDMDFLVRRQDLPRVCELLELEGYRRTQTLTSAQQRHHEREAKEYEYCRRDTLGQNQFAQTVYLEPHWSITMRKFPFPIDYSGLWRRAQRMDFDGTPLFSFAPEDAVLILCAVGSKSQWKRLLMICDFAEAIQKYRDIDWAHCLERAGNLGCRRMLLTAIVLASELLDSRPSQEMVMHAQSDRKAMRLAKEICDRLFQPARASVLPFSHLLWSMRERPRDKIQYFVRTLTTPRLVHLRRLPLPEPLFPLYRLIVPIHDCLLVPCGRVGGRIWDLTKRVGSTTRRTASR
jgi:hypothetical protein